MRLSESIRKGVLDVRGGGITNRFKVSSRRPTFFFDDIGLEYVRRVDRAGLGPELRALSKEWGAIMYDSIFPPAMKKLPWKMAINMVMSEIFRLLGYMEGIRCERKGSLITLRTSAEENVKRIGINSLNTGLYMGLLSVVFGSDVSLVRAFQERPGDCAYEFRMLGKPFRFESKEKGAYDALNRIPPARASSIRDALRAGIMKADGNRLLFRGKPISSLENTIFHLFGARSLLMEEVPDISYAYFRELVREDSGREEKLNLLKNLLQMMGWGLFTVVSKEGGREVAFHIECPPYGFQKSDDNWDFLSRVMLGYLWLIDRGFRITGTRSGPRRLAMTFAAPGRRASGAGGGPSQSVHQ
jgi:hypothetical protein